MKVKNYFSVLFMALAMCLFGLSSCGGDDDSGSNSGGNSSGGGSSAGGSVATVSGGNQSFSVNKAYFTAENQSNGKVYYILQFFNCDYYEAMQTRDANMLPETIYGVSVVYEAPGSITEPATGEFTDFFVNLSAKSKQGLISGTDVKGSQYNSESEGRTIEGIKLTVSKNGNNYTVSFGEMNYIDIFKGNDHSIDFRGSAFSYTGPIVAIPSGLVSVN